MALRISLLLAAVLALCACNSYSLRYAAEPQPSGAKLFADYTQLQDSIGVSIDTDGRRLEDIYITKADGSIVRPVNIVYPGFGKSGAIGTGIGIGGGHVGFGSGIAVPIGPERAKGLTAATFSTAAVGAAPWQLHVKVQGISEAVVPALGGPATAK